MADGSKIEWTDATWNPITGCSVLTPGCTNCYAMKLAGTRLAHHPSRAGLTTMTKAGPVWNGEVRFNPDWLDMPLRWSRPRMVFVCAHGDLFHESVPDEWIDKVFAVMALCSQHKFQVLTKRAKRMQSYLSGAAAPGRIWFHAMRMAANWMDSALATTRASDWPYPNVWLGVSAEDQARFDLRWRYLSKTPAAITFLSLEPLLGPIFFRPAKPDWVIVGGESGPGARPMHPDWAREIRDQCIAASVSFFMKQMTKKAPIPPDLFIREIPHAT